MNCCLISLLLNCKNMIVIHIESGLGNQMLSYCEYLAAKKMNPRKEIYIETIVYEIPECNAVISQWNGFELESVFGIKPRNIKELFSKEQWERIITHVRSSEFWKKGWNYSDVIIEALRKEGVELTNCRKKYDDFQGRYATGRLKLKHKFYNTFLGYWIRNAVFYFWGERIIKSKEYEKELFIVGENIYSGQKLDFNKKHSGIELIEDEIRKCFAFPQLKDPENVRTEKLICESNSIGVHLRRGDMLNVADKYYRFGYFKRAVKYIKAKINDPVFYIFGDTEAIDWAEKNLEIIGISKSDKYVFVRSNSEENSYIDMQLMSMCKHQIISNSSFGWWASFLNNYPNKITCSPEYIYNTTNWF